MTDIKNTWLARNIVYLIALFVATIWGVFTMYLGARAIKLVGATADLTGVLSIYSTVTAVFMTVLNFYFGSSKGSQEKQEKLNELTQAPK